MLAAVLALGAVDGASAYAASLDAKVEAHRDKLLARFAENLESYFGITTPAQLNDALKQAYLAISPDQI